MNISRLRTRLQSRLQTYQQAVKQVKTEKAGLDKAREDLTVASHGLEVLQIAAQTIQQQAHQRISLIVSRCLTAVFDDPYDFKIEFKRKRNRTDAQLTLYKDGLDYPDPSDATGGGVVDIASFGLRLASLVLSRPHLRKVLIIDEPFKMVSADLRERVSRMLEMISEELDVQIIMITHDPAFMIGKVIELK